MDTVDRFIGIPGFRILGKLPKEIPRDIIQNIGFATCYNTDCAYVNNNCAGFEEPHNIN
jgi:hypothetical protein